MQNKPYIWATKENYQNCHLLQVALKKKEKEKKKKND